MYVITVLYQSSEPRVSTQDHTIATTRSHVHSSGRGEWKVGVAKHVLVPSCHCDLPDAQKWVELGQSAFQGKLVNVVRFRLILRQPSPHWRQFGIQNFSCYHHDSSAATTHLSVVSREHEGCGLAGTMERLLEVGRRAHSGLKSEEEKDCRSLGSQHLYKRQPYQLNLLSTL